MIPFPTTFHGSAVAASCDFPGTDDYLSRTHTLGNRRTWTFSCFAKLDTAGAQRFLLSALTSAQGAFMLPSTNTIAYFEFADPSYDIRESGGSSSETGTWDHYCLVVDTTDGTSNNRVKIWKNGSPVSFTEFDTEPSLNFQTRIGSGTAHNIGRAVFDGTGDFNGKLAEVCLVDGQALTPASFASGNSPILPNPLWGSGGFWLRFQTAGNLGKDSSGNGNDWTVNGSLSQSTDVP